MSPDQLEKLESVAKTLNSEPNDLNALIGALNAKLAKFNVGSEVWLSLDEDHYQIGYAKVDDKWQLATRWCEEIRWVNDDRYAEGGYFAPSSSNYKITPLSQASRELRIRALDHMDAIGNLTHSAQARRKSIQDVKKLVAEL